MSYNQKPPGPGGSGGMGNGPPNGPNNPQQVAKTLAGIQQQMQNLVHGQTPQPDLFTSLQQQRLQNMFKQQQQFLHFQQMQQQQQQQQQQQHKDRAGSGGSGEPLALTRTPAAAELLNKTYQQHHQQQPNGSSAVTAAAAATNPALNQFQQQLQAISPNIMQQLQAFQYQMQQHQQQQQQHHPQPQQSQHHMQQPQQQAPAALPVPHQQQQLHGQAATHQQQQKALSTAVQQFQQSIQQRYLSAAAAVSAQSAATSGGNKVSSTPPPPPPPLANQMKPPNLPPSTQITPVPANTGSSGSGSANPTSATAKTSTAAAAAAATSSVKQVAPSISLLPAKQSANSPTPAAAHQHNKFGTGKAAATAPVISAIPPPFPTHFQKPSMAAPTVATIHTKGATNADVAAVVLKSPQANPVPLTKPPATTTAPVTAASGSSTGGKVVAATSVTTTSNQEAATDVLTQNTSQQSPPKSATTPIAAGVPAATVPVTASVAGKNTKSDAGGTKSAEATVVPSVKTVLTPAAAKSATAVVASVTEKAPAAPAVDAVPVDSHASTLKLADKVTKNAGTVSTTTTAKQPQPPKLYESPVAEEKPVADAAPKEKSQTDAVAIAQIKEDGKSVEERKEKSPINLVDKNDYLKVEKNKDTSAVIEIKQLEPTGDGVKAVIATTDTPKSGITVVTESPEKSTDSKPVIKLEKNIEASLEIKGSNDKLTPEAQALPKDVESLPKMKSVEAISSNTAAADDVHAKAKASSVVNAKKSEETKEQIVTDKDNKASQEKSIEKVTKEEKPVKVVSKVEKEETKMAPLAANAASPVPETTNANAKVHDVSGGAIVDVATPVRKLSRQSKSTKAAGNAQASTTPSADKTSSKSERATSSRSSREEKRKSKSDAGANTVTTSTPATPKEEDGNASDRKSQRHRLKTILYQSPLPELAYITKLSASEASNSPKPMSTDDRLIVFYKNEYMAVRNAEGTFYLCQTMQNVYRTSPRISIRWLSEDAKDSSVYIPDFYDHTDIECVLTTVELKRVDKGHLRLPKTEKARIESILKKAIDVEKGLAPRPELTEANPDGLDISLYKDESQIEKKTSGNSTPSAAGRKHRRSGNSSAASKTTTALSAGAKRKRGAAASSAGTSGARKSPARKRKALIKRKKKSKGSTSDEDNYDDSTDGYESDAEYKPNQKKPSNSTAAKSSPRAQRSPLAKARAASPITPTTSRSKNVPQKLTNTPAPATTSSRGERATKRKIAATDSATVADIPVLPAKRANVVAAVATNVTAPNNTNTSKPTNAKSKIQDGTSEATASKKVATETVAAINNTATEVEPAVAAIAELPVTAIATPLSTTTNTPAISSGSGSSAAGNNRPTRSRK